MQAPLRTCQSSVDCLAHETNVALAEVPTVETSFTTLYIILSPQR